MIPRKSYTIIRELLKNHSAVGLLGPRQVGKTTLAHVLSNNYDSIYLDLESPKDLSKLNEPELYLASQSNKLIIIDEVQRKPELFQILRVDIDKSRRQGHKFGRFLLLGSASLDLLKQSSESLAGRIYYHELTGLTLDEIKQNDFHKLWLRGGFPDSYLASSDNISAEWRKSFITTYLERDIPLLGPRIPAETLRRFWTMLAHSNGQLLNLANLSSALGVSGSTVSRYLDLLVDILMVRKLEPWFSNNKKRLVKSSKIYIRDTGLLHTLLGINTMDTLYSNPIIGSSWEGFVVQNILSSSKVSSANFYRSSGGAEIDLLINVNGKLWAIEIKYSLTPKISKGFYSACEDLSPDRKIIIYPGEECYYFVKDILVMPLLNILKELN